MKTVKSLLLGTAAGFVAFTGAQAADLPMAEPVEYVKICDTYGKGYFYIPGTDTCLKLSGYVRVSTMVNFSDQVDQFADDDGFVGMAENDQFRMRSRASVRWDARSETEWGTLRSFIEMRGNAGFGDNGNSDFDLEQAFVQFAGITAGRAQSFFDYIPYDSFEDFFDDNKINTIAYTASFGSGFAATIGIEDKATGDRSTLYNDGEVDQVWPNIVAALRVDQAWGSAQVSGAVQDNQGDRDEFSIDFPPIEAEDEIGWAVQAGLSINLPTANEGSFISAQGCYSEGAIQYCGAGNIPYGTDGGGSGFNNFLDLGFFNDQSLGSGLNNIFWQVGGAIGFQATETVNLQVVGTFFEFDNEVIDEADFTGFKLEGKAVWTPVDNLDLGLALQYVSLDGTGNALDDDGDPLPGFGVDGTVDDIRVEGRIQRNF